MRAGVSTPQIAATEGRRSRQAESEDRTGGEKDKNRIAAHRVSRGVAKAGAHPAPGYCINCLVLYFCLHQQSRARMHTASSAHAQPQQQQHSQQMRAASEIAQRSCEPLPINSFVKAHGKADATVDTSRQSCTGVEFWTKREHCDR